MELGTRLGEQKLNVIPHLASRKRDWLWAIVGRHDLGYIVSDIIIISL
jgi:hypothetical protein